ncbi:hypothetical protein GGI04_002907, partial [Coemansia thaxteri]
MSDSRGSAAASERGKAREKLRAFYKLQPQQAGSGTPRRVVPLSSLGQAVEGGSVRRTGKAGKVASPLDIDGQAFDARKYLKKLLVEEGVAGLLAKDNQLVSEVRQIDGDMKTMVYENYSKFISATETIGKMKRDADFMDAEMEKLSRRVNLISGRTDSVNARFAGRREAIARLNGEYGTLRRLQFLFDLPDELNRHISMGRFVEAARVWSRTQPQLEHYRQLGVFAGVEKDGKEIMASVEATIWARWRDASTGIGEGAECASLLVLLRPEKARELWREYLEIQGAKNRHLRQAALDECYKSPAAGGAARQQQRPADAAQADADAGASSATPSSPPTGASRISAFNERYLPAWSSLVVGFASQFMSPSGSGLLEQARSAAAAAAQGGRAMSLLEATTEGTVVGLLSPLADDRQPRRNVPPVPSASSVVVGWQAMSAADLGEAQRAFAEHSREWCAEYEFIVDSLLQPPDDAASGTANTQAFLAQADALVACAGAFPILARIGGLHECIDRMVARWQERLVGAALHAVVRDMIERLEFYFDPLIDAPDSAMAVASGVLTPSLVSGVGRHQRNASVKSTGSQASAHPPDHQRSGSVLSNTWAGPPAERAAALARGGADAGSPVGLGAPQGPGMHSPLQVSTQPPNARSLAQARAVSSAFEALSNPPSAPLGMPPSSLSPALASGLASGLASAGAGGSGAAPQRPSRASTASAASAWLAHNSAATAGAGAGAGSRTGALRRTRHQRANSSAYTDTATEAGDESARPALFSGADLSGYGALGTAPPQS